MPPLRGGGPLFGEPSRSKPTAPWGGPAGPAGVGLFSDDPPSRSLFHRLAFDEVWHFYGGDPLRLVLLHPDGSDAEVILGGAQAVQHVISAGVWQAGGAVPRGGLALFGWPIGPGVTPGRF